MKIDVGDVGKTTTAHIIDDVLYIDEPRKEFLPKYAYYLCISKNCRGIAFRNSSKIYTLNKLKELEDNWKDVKEKNNKNNKK